LASRDKLGPVAIKARPPADLAVRLTAPEDLFRAPEPHLFLEHGRLISGVEELILALQGRRVPKCVRATIVLAKNARGEDPETLTRLIRRYCDLRLREVELRMRAQGREQRRAILVGSMLFLLGVALAGEFTASFWPDEIRSLLGDGIFLVVAWVGLWYPLDYLVFGRRPLLLERRILQALRRAEIRVEREQEDAGVKAPPGAVPASPEPSRGVTSP
jgi:hypothetical protein